MILKNSKPDSETPKQFAPSIEAMTQDRKLKIPPPVYMLLFAGGMWLVDKRLPVAIWLHTPWNKLGWLIVVLSFIPAAGAFRLFNRIGTTANPFRPHSASTLVTSGIFHYSRNPMYLSLLFLLIGWAIYLGSLSAMLIPPLFVWVLTTQQIRYKEQALEKVFGSEYLNYKRSVRRWM